jgi:hypothetical protein
MPEAKRPVDIVERMLRSAKELAVLALAIYLGWYLVPFVPAIAKSLAKSLETSNVTEVNVAGITVKLQQAASNLAKVKDQLDQDANKPKDVPVDKSVPPENKLVVDAIESIRAAAAQAGAATKPAAVQPPAVALDPSAAPNEAFWVYLGQAKGDTLIAKNFRASTVPSPGDVIVANADVYKRNAAPAKRNNEWYLGDTVGVLKTGQSVTVRRIERIPSTNPDLKLIWAQVVPAQST